MACRSLTAHDLEQGLGDQLRRPPLSALRGRALWRAIQALGAPWSDLGEMAVRTWLGQYVEAARAVQVLTAQDLDASYGDGRLVWCIALGGCRDPPGAAGLPCTSMCAVPAWPWGRPWGWG